jgi:hypothetical protein
MVLHDASGWLAAADSALAVQHDIGQCLHCFVGMHGCIRYVSGPKQQLGYSSDEFVVIVLVTNKIQRDNSNAANKIQRDNSNATNKIQRDNSNATNKIQCDNSNAANKIQRDNSNAAKDAPSKPSYAANKKPLPQCGLSIA